MKKRSSAKLSLKSETVRTLTDPEMSGVAGGWPSETPKPSTGVPCITYTCSSWIAHCQCTPKTSDCPISYA
jgi:hypothetical protein